MERPRNGNGKRGPGRPPGPCPTPYKPHVPRRTGVVHIYVDVTRADAARVEKRVDAMDLATATLVERAQSGDASARQGLRDRLRATLPLVEAAAAGLPPSAVLSSRADPRSVAAAAAGERAVFGSGSPWPPVPASLVRGGTR